MARNGKKTSFYNWPKLTKGQGLAEKQLSLISAFIWKVLPLTLRAPRGGRKRPPLGFSSVVFARGMILKRNFG